MDSYVLLKTQKNKILKVLESYGLNPSEFIWEEKTLTRIPMVVGEGLISCLVHKPTSYFFEFDIRIEKDYYLKYSPGNNSPNEKVKCINWEGILLCINHWAKYLRREIEAPDLWDMLFDEIEILKYAENETSEEQFSSQQKEQIQNSLTEIKNYISTNFVETSEKIELLENKINYISDAVDRMSKQDWIHTAIGVFFTIFIGLGLLPDQAKTIFNHIGSIFSNLKSKLISK